MNLRRVRDIDWRNLPQRRGGVVPVLRGPTTTFYVFTVDACHASISDMAGRMEDEDADLLDTCLREFGEESFMSFGPLSRQDVADDHVLETNDTVLILHDFDYDLLDRYVQRGHKIASSNPCFETQDFLPLTGKQVRRILSTRARVDKVRPYLVFDKLRVLLTKYQVVL